MFFNYNQTMTNYGLDAKILQLKIGDSVIILNCRYFETVVLIHLIKRT